MLSGGGATQTSEAVRYASRIGQHVGRPNPDDLQAKPPQIMIPYIVSRDSVCRVMNLAIHLDYQPGCRAVEVCDVAANCMLTTKTDSCRRTAQQAPQPHFGRSHRTPLLARRSH